MHRLELWISFFLCVITLCTRKAPWMEFMTQHGEFSRNFFFAYRLPCLSKPLKNLRKCNTWKRWWFFHSTEGRSRWTIWTNHAACSNYSSARGWLTATANITKWEGQQWVSETKAVLHPDKDWEGEVYYQHSMSNCQCLITVYCKNKQYHYCFKGLFIPNMKLKCILLL